MSDQSALAEGQILWLYGDCHAIYLRARIREDLDMPNRLVTFFGLSALLVFPCAASAQNVPPAPGAMGAQTLNPETLSAITKGGTIHSGRMAQTGPLLAVTTGWNYVHATNCETYYDGAQDWYFLYPV